MKKEYIINKEAYFKRKRENQTSITIRVDKYAKEDWKEAASKYGVPLKNLIYHAVYEYIANHKPD